MKSDLFCLSVFWRKLNESMLFSENEASRLEGFENLCRIIGDPSFSEEHRISALVQLMSLEGEASKSILQRVEKRLPKLYEAALERGR